MPLTWVLTISCTYHLDRYCCPGKVLLQTCRYRAGMLLGGVAEGRVQLSLCVSVGRWALSAENLFMDSASSPLCVSIVSFHSFLRLFAVACPCFPLSCPPSFSLSLCLSVVSSRQSPFFRCTDQPDFEWASFGHYASPPMESGCSWLATTQ